MKMNSIKTSGLQLERAVNISEKLSQHMVNHRAHPFDAELTFI